MALERRSFILNPPSDMLVSDQQPSCELGLHETQGYAGAERAAVERPAPTAARPDRTGRVPIRSSRGLDGFTEQPSIASALKPPSGAKNHAVSARLYDR